MRGRDAVRLVFKAFEKRIEDREFMKYVSILPHFTKNNFKTFEEFYKAPNQTKVSTRSAEEIMRDAEEIMRKVGEKRGTVQAVRTDIGGQQQGE